MVLGDELAGMGDDRHAQACVRSQDLAHQGGDDQGLAGTGRQDHEPGALTGLPGGMDGVEAGALIGTKLHQPGQRHT